MDVLPILEGATYLAFIVGAIVAVYELRDLRETRELETSLRLADQWLNRDFVQATVKVLRAEFKTAKEVQDQGLDVDAKYVADLFDWYAGLIRDGRIDRRSVDLAFAGCYKMLEPWIVWFEKEHNTERYDALRWAAGEEPKWELEDEKKLRQSQK